MAAFTIAHRIAEEYQRALQGFALLNPNGLPVLTEEERDELIGEIGFEAQKAFMNRHTRTAEQEQSPDSVEAAKPRGAKGSAPPTTAEFPLPTNHKGKQIDARMLAMIRDDSESIYWSAEEWAKKLRCSKSTVVATKTWKETIKTIRSDYYAKTGLPDHRRRPRKRPRSGT